MAPRLFLETVHHAILCMLDDPVGFLSSGTTSNLFFWNLAQFWLSYLTLGYLALVFMPWFLGPGPLALIVRGPSVGSWALGPLAPLH